VVEPATTILLVEDEAAIRRSIASTLVADGFRVIEAATARDAAIHAKSYNPELLLIDLGLPDQDGLELIRELRTWCRAPIVILSARGREEEKVKGLDAGADDYLAKPFGLPELQARVRAALRRELRSAGAGDDATIAFGDLELDLAEHRARRGSEELKLTPIEFKLLAALMRRAGRLVTHDQLLRDVWGPSVAEEASYLRVYVHHLRRKLEEDASRPRRLLTEVGIGYRLVAP
jgi:two-component system, OmpR family, KDP operon response regulator KdpE